MISIHDWYPHFCEANYHNYQRTIDSRVFVDDTILGRIQVADKNFEAGLANLKAAYETEKNHENVKLIYRLSEFMGKKEDGYEFLKAHGNS